MFKKLLIFVALTTVSGCAGLNWSRLAPPGIIKYEEIASKKPPNPAIEEVLRERSNNNEPEFPVLSQTPAAGKPPERRPAAEVEADLKELSTARDALDANVEADRAAVEADKEDAGAILSGRDALSREIDKDEAAAKNERKETIGTSQ